MDRDEEFARSIRQRDITAIRQMMFGGGSSPRPRSGFRTETDLWDYKVSSPAVGRGTERVWASVAADVLAFHNHRGGVLLFGISDDLRFVGARTRLDSKLFNDQLRKFLPDTIWVEYHREYIQSDQKYLGLAVIPPRGARIERFKRPGPEDGNKRMFDAGGSAIREGDSTKILSKAAADALARSLAVPTVGRVYAVDQPFYRVLAPEYDEFIYRKVPCELVEKGLRDRRTAVTSVIGIGGVGKTALATWAALRAYEYGEFAFIASTTAKDRELTSIGIHALEPALTSFESLLDAVLDVLGFPEVKAAKADEKEREVRGLLEDANGLLYVDNLETVDDPRIISFLDSLPLGTKALVTSRRANVRVSVYPVDLGALSEEEVVQFIDSLRVRPELGYIKELSRTERVRVGRACDGIPLAVRWVLASSRSAGEALVSAENLTSTSRHGEELLEFSFRRVFESLSDTEKAILQVLSLFQRPIPTEAVLAGSGLQMYALRDALDDLIDDALVQRLFDSERNDYVYTLLPVTRAFVSVQVSKEPKLEQTIRQALSNWYEARDVKGLNERRVIREIRQGRGGSDSALVDLAFAAERRGDIYGAEELYQQALRRNQNSWKAARLYGELLRHKLNNVTAALTMYERAAANAPMRGPDRARIFREWGMLLRDSGDPDATDRAIEKFETALAETPNDAVTIHALAGMLARKGSYRRVIQLLEPLVDHPNKKTRELTLPLLLRAYEAVDDMFKAAQIRARISGS